MACAAGAGLGVRPFYSSTVCARISSRSSSSARWTTRRGTFIESATSAGEYPSEIGRAILRSVSSPSSESPVQFTSAGIEREGLRPVALSNGVAELPARSRAPYRRGFRSRGRQRARACHSARCSRHGQQRTDQGGQTRGRHATSISGTYGTPDPGNHAGLLQPRRTEWAHLGSNQGPPACEAGALPLSYAPREGQV